MDPDIVNEVNDVMSNMKDKDIDKKTNAIRLAESDPLFSLKTNLFEFFKKRLEIIQNEESFRIKIKEAILEKIENGEFSEAQLIQLYNATGDQSTTSTNSILDIFKPGRDGGVSPLVQRETMRDHSTPTEISPSDAEALNSLVEIVKRADNHINQREPEKDSNEM
jgi:hypothetical protein